MLATEHRWWRDINRAQTAYAGTVHRLETTRARWDARIAAAMRGVEPRVWWRYNRRIASGQRWVASKAEGRWVQRVVYLTRDQVLELCAQRDALLAPLEVACVAAEARLKEAIRRPVAVFGVSETACRLGLSVPTVTALTKAPGLRAKARRELCGGFEVPL